jgi:amino acid adenylation domain-containing protein
MSIHARFEEQVRRTPQAVAIVAEQEQMTYAALDARANALAGRLQRLGVGFGSCVILALDRSCDSIASLLAILKLGAAYVPADPSHPAERLAALAEDCEAAAIVTPAAACGAWPAGIPVLCPVAGVPLPDGPAMALERGIETDDAQLAYVLFTSGSSGRPKGVMVEHRSVLHLAEALHAAVYENGEEPLRISLNAPLAFDASVQQIVQLLFGHTLVIVPESVRREGAALLDFLRQARIDVFDGTPAHLRMLLAAGLLSADGQCPSRMLIGGEAIDRPTWLRMRTCRRIRFYNVYGPTECTVDATCCPVQSGPDLPSIGKALPGYRVDIRRPDLQPCAAGETGEIVIAGPGLARGYLKNPDLTAQRFVADPAGGGRLYRTGDLGRCLPDGNIEFLGRADGQVKLRGYRMELGEIEAAVHRHPAVREAVVSVQPGPAEDKRLVGYLVPSGSPASVSELRAFCRRHLPDYMVPGVFMWVDRLPLTGNGKVDRKALPRPHSERPRLDSDYIAPADAIEQRLAELWSEVLAIQPVGTQDNFFDLGGSSLTSIQLHAHAQRRGLEFPLHALLAHQTIAGVASAIRQGKPA